MLYEATPHATDKKTQMTKSLPVVYHLLPYSQPAFHLPRPQVTITLIAIRGLSYKHRGPGVCFLPNAHYKSTGFGASLTEFIMTLDPEFT